MKISVLGRDSTFMYNKINRKFQIIQNYFIYCLITPQSYSYEAKDTVLVALQWW